MIIVKEEEVVEKIISLKRYFYIKDWSLHDIYWILKLEIMV